MPKPIDMDRVLRRLGLGAAVSDKKALLLAKMVLQEWQALSRDLKTTRAAYKAALQLRRVGEGWFRVSLPDETVDAAAPKVAMIARMIEFGMGPGGIGTSGPYDIRTFLLRETTRRVHHGKNGLYVNVPFDHTAKGIRELGGSSALRQAQRLSGTSTIGGATSWGDRLPEGLAPKSQPHHSTDLLAGLVRLAAQYNGAGSKTSGYRTWRRASWTAPAPKWTSKGIRARHYGDLVFARLPDLMKQAGI